MPVASAQIIFCLGGEFKGNLVRIERMLPVQLSKDFGILCFEFPKFKNFLKLISGSQKLHEHIGKIRVFHSFGILPFGRSFTIINKLNHLLNFLLFSELFKIPPDSILVSFTPEASYFPRVGSKFSKIIYHAIDNYTSLPFWNNRRAKNQFRSLEKKYLELADTVITASNPLFHKYRKLHNNVNNFPTPYIPENLSSKTNQIPPDMKELKKPIVGFYGEFDDWRIDTDLMLSVIKSLPKFSFAIIGLLSIKNKKLLADFMSMSNFRYLGFKEKSVTASYLKHFDVCIIPYKSDNYGKFAYPVKINEYLQFGKPVVTTNLPSLSDLNSLVYISNSESQFIGNLGKAAMEKNPYIIRERIRYASANSWGIRLKQYLTLLNNGKT